MQGAAEYIRQETTNVTLRIAAASLFATLATCGPARDRCGSRPLLYLLHFALRNRGRFSICYIRGTTACHGHRSCGSRPLLYLLHSRARSAIAVTWTPAADRGLPLFATFHSRYRSARQSCGSRPLLYLLHSTRETSRSPVYAADRGRFSICYIRRHERPAVVELRIAAASLFATFYNPRARSTRAADRGRFSICYIRAWSGCDTRHAADRGRFSICYIPRRSGTGTTTAADRGRFSICYIERRSVTPAPGCGSRPLLYLLHSDIGGLPTIRGCGSRPLLYLLHSASCRWPRTPCCGSRPLLYLLHFDGWIGL